MSRGYLPALVLPGSVFPRPSGIQATSCRDIIAPDSRGARLHFLPEMAEVRRIAKEALEAIRVVSTPT
jgi:hypothetical protein